MMVSPTGKMSLAVVVCHRSCLPLCYLQQSPTTTTATNRLKQNWQAQEASPGAHSTDHGHDDSDDGDDKRTPPGDGPIFGRGRAAGRR